MSSFETLITKTPVVVILDEVDPYCHKVLDIVNGFKINKENLTLYYVDKEPKGDEVLEALKTQSKGDDDNNLPYIYLGGKLYYNGQKLVNMQSNTVFRNELVSVNAITLPALEKVKALVASNVLVVFLTKFSAFCESFRAILKEYVPTSYDKLELVFIDERTDGKDLLEAAQYLANTEDTPVIFLANEPFGTLKEFTGYHDKMELHDKLSDKGFIPALPHEKLKKLKENTKILIIGNSYSAFSLSLVETFNNLQLPTGALRIETEGAVAEGLEKAAMVDTKNKEGPYLYINGEFVAHKAVEAMSETELMQFLKSKSAI